MTEGSWPPRVRESHDSGDRPRSVDAPDEPPAYGTPSASETPKTSEDPRTYVPAPAEPGTPESIGVVDSGRTRVERPSRKGRRARRLEGIHEDRPVETDDDEGREPRKGRLLIGLLIGALVVVSALAVTFMALWLGSSETSPEEVRAFLDEERQAVEDRARLGIDILINYDSTNLEQRRDEMLEISTGGFRDDYDQFTQSLGPVLKEAAASSRGSILEEPRVSFISPEEANAIARVEQIAQTRENPSGRTITYILRVGLIDTQDGWKVDDIEILSDEIT